MSCSAIHLDVTFLSTVLIVQEIKVKLFFASSVKEILPHTSVREKEEVQSFGLKSALSYLGPENIQQGAEFFFTNCDQSIPHHVHSLSSSLVEISCAVGMRFANFVTERHAAVD